ncbi:hypothetical protein AB0B31_10980 [Catellatospora citrea]|uniref:hypothetical protein n=1 Tax=Catellatospora citrea TaxID=53366 RepID=UPI0033D5FD95
MNTPLALPAVTMSAVEQAAAVHSARLQTALLAARARRVAVTAVRAGWWAHFSADMALTGSGLPGLPMIWPTRVHLPLQVALFAVDAESAMTAARRDITSHLASLLDRDDPMITLTINAAAIDTTQPDETDRHHYLVDATATIAVPATCTSERDAINLAAEQAAARLAGHSHLTLRRPPHAALPAEWCPFDLDAPVLDPDADGPDLTTLQHLLADPHHDRSQAVTPAALDAGLTRLRRSLRRHIIDAIDDGIGIRKGDDPHTMTDQILTAMGLDPLPRSWQYEISTTITHIVAADTPGQAVTASNRLLMSSRVTSPPRSLPITLPDTCDPRPKAKPAGAGWYEVTRQLSFLACLRGGDHPALAEAAVRQHLSTADPGFGDLPLRVIALGRRIERIVDRDTD